MTTGLEHRGTRPEPGTRGALAVFIWKSLDRHWRLVQPQIAHEMIYGVPVGPTLNMVHPPKLLGLQVVTSTAMPRDRVYLVAPNLAERLAGSALSDRLNFVGQINL